MLKWGWARSILAAGLVVSLFGWAYGPGAEPMPQSARYVCENGKAFAVEFLADPPSARVAFDGRLVTLPQTIAATDAKYTDGHSTLYIRDTNRNDGVTG